jgi:DNA polymerase-4
MTRRGAVPPPSGLGSDGARAVLHVDMDAFYVSVELRRRPELVGKPVVVGGDGARGVVAAASYEARRFGVFSAMPASRARRLCPDAVFLPGDHELYSRVSREVHEIFGSVTPLVEPLALDEAFLDVTGSIGLLGPVETIAAAIRARVRDELALQCSVGGAVNKLLAKLASKAAKPVASPGGVRPGRGVVLVEPGSELDFLHPLPVSALWGVGPATRARLDRLGVSTVGDLAQLERSVLMTALGAAQGALLHDLAWGRDQRPVEADREMKSLGQEETFGHDRHSLAELRHEAVRIADSVAGRLRATGTAARTVAIKVRFSDFTTITRSRSADSPVTTAAAILEVVEGLLIQVDPGPGVRLFGITLSNFTEAAEQLSFDDLGPGDRVRRDWTSTSAAVDAIRERFGTGAIGPASTVTNEGLRVGRRRKQQWGPET